MMGDRGWANTFPTACAACANDAACNSACGPYVYSLYNNTSWSEHAGDYPGQLGNYGVSIQGVLGGDETVPTVFVGTRSLVNPSIGQVESALRELAPNLLEQPGKRSWFRRR